MARWRWLGCAAQRKNAQLAATTAGIRLPHRTEATQLGPDTRLFVRSQLALFYPCTPLADVNDAGRLSQKIVGPFRMAGSPPIRSDNHQLMTPLYIQQGYGARPTGAAAGRGKHQER
jgi:hypothetical protein